MATSCATSERPGLPAAASRLQAGRDLPALTGFRGIAAVVVVLYHYTEMRYPRAPTTLEPFAGYLGVDLFFILSGFLMALNYGRLFAGGFSVHAYKLFLVRRFARVYPLYLVVTLVVFAWAKLSGAEAHARTLVTNLFLIQQLGVGYINPLLGVSIAGPAWSISTEFGAYLLFPLLFALAVSGSKKRTIGISSTAFVALVIMAYIPWSYKPQGVPVRGLLDLWNGADLWALMRCLADFSLGLVTYRFATGERTEAWADERLGMACASGALICLFTLYADIAAIIIFCVLILHLSFSASRVAKLLAGSAIIYLGEVSYAVYLTHYWTLQLVDSQVHRFVALPTGLVTLLMPLTAGALCLVLSRLCFLYVEKPSRNYLKRFA